MADKDYTYRTIGDGLKLVTTAGTREALVADSTKVRLVEIQARPENTGVVVVGSSSCVAASGTRRGYALVPGQSVGLRIDDLADLYVDVAVSGEGVSYVYFND
jgi:hypothetical protein